MADKFGKCMPLFIGLMLLCFLDSVLARQDGGKNNIRPTPELNKHEAVLNRRQFDNGGVGGQFTPEAFKELDTDKDGFITFEEGVSHLEKASGNKSSMQNKIPLQQRHATFERIFQSLDKDNDKKISESEFVKNPAQNRGPGFDKFKRADKDSRNYKQERLLHDEF